MNLGNWMIYNDTIEGLTSYLYLEFWKIDKSLFNLAQVRSAYSIALC